MPKCIAIIQGHPSPGGGHFCHALATSYAQGAAGAGYEVRQIVIADLDFPLLRTRQEWEDGAPPPAIRECQETIARAEHLVIVYPLWLGTMPAILKAFLEQVFRPGFATSKVEGGKLWTKLLTGKTARVVVTMGMPALVYRWYFGAHSLKSLERNILDFAGIGPIRESLVGSVEASGDVARRKWLEKMHALGRQGL
jgi:putative NADPH-quinone reductase